MQEHEGQRTASELWDKAFERIRALNTAYKGLASMFDMNMERVSPMAVARTFGNHYFCTCAQVLMIIQIFDSSKPNESSMRVNMVQVLFTRIVDLWHFSDVLRECTPPEQVQLMQRCGYLNCIYTNRRDLFHLHGLCFLIHMSVEEEYRVARTIAEYVEKVPKQPAAGQKPQPIFRNLLINGSPATLSEDREFWETLCTIAMNRMRSGSTWDPKGTLEFQVMYPEPWLRGMAAQLIQRVWRGYRGRKRFQELFDEHMKFIQRSDTAMRVAELLGKSYVKKLSPTKSIKRK
uniref:Uncharacterized protein n=1 Tax=Tetraselmis sp. GSL018 TaxID=582737 RepID=A0A061QZ58_9CHLO